MPVLNNQGVHSYREDPSMPSFDDSGPVVFMDGECALCTRGARIISRIDRRREFKICPTQSQTGQAVLAHYGLDPADPDSWLYLDQGRAYTSMDAIIRVGRRVGGIGYLPSALSILPHDARDWIYQRIARNRYRLFGRADMCTVPDPELQSRLIG